MPDLGLTWLVIKVGYGGLGTAAWREMAVEQSGMDARFVWVGLIYWGDQFLDSGMTSV